MVLVDKIELFHKNDLETPDTIRRPETGKIVVEWVRRNGAYCARIVPDRVENFGSYLGGNCFGRMKLYFRNGHIWDTALKPEDEWRKMIYETLKCYIDSGYNRLPGVEQTSLEKAAELLDNDEFEDI